MIDVILLGGLLLWLFGRPATHVGANGLIFGLMAFLIVSGFREKRIVPLIVSVIVGFLYGGTLLSGVLPRFGSQVSWDGHLFGAIGGEIIAYALTRERRPHVASAGIGDEAQRNRRCDKRPIDTQPSGFYTSCFHLQTN